jgi:hypothetical protein
VVNYGDGSQTESLTLTPDKTYQLDHTFTTVGVFTVQVTITDSTGYRGYGAFGVTVTGSTPPLVQWSPAGTPWASHTITYSFAPDGTQWDHGVSDLFAVFDARFGAPSRWESEIARALNDWAGLSDIHLVQVSDSGDPWNTPGSAQNDPRFGDIRFAGYEFSDPNTLAYTYYPDNASTGAGDVTFNTAQSFAIGADYDLFTVALHETGHALGLGHAQDPNQVMYATYHGIVSGPQGGDTVGIQSLYGPPAPSALPTPSPTPSPPPPAAQPNKQSPLPTLHRGPRHAAPKKGYHRKGSEVDR